MKALKTTDTHKMAELTFIDFEFRELLAVDSSGDLMTIERDYLAPFTAQIAYDRIHGTNTYIIITKDDGTVVEKTQIGSNYYGPIFHDVFSGYGWMFHFNNEELVCSTGSIYGMDKHVPGYTGFW